MCGEGLVVHIYKKNYQSNLSGFNAFIYDYKSLVLLKMMPVPLSTMTAAVSLL